MRIEVIGTAADAGRHGQFAGRTAVVIDVLRATSTIVTALAAGASAIIPAVSVEEAYAVRRPGDVLGGERRCRRIDGFDLGNSPAEYTAQAVAGRRIVLATTNGTVALRRASNADAVLAASLLNAGACAEAAAALGRDVVIVCAGREGVFSLEDGYAAGCFLTRLEKTSEKPLACDDLGIALKWLYARHEGDPRALLARGGAGRRLAAIGMAGDIAACASVDRHRLVPRLRNGELAAEPLTAAFA